MTTFGSVCSGIEAASVAFHPLGWRAAWFSEIEAFPSAVLAHHYPEVPNLGDMTKIAKAVLLGEVHAPDILCGGTPCQAFSVAGLRESLADDRGNLTLKFVELADAIDHVRGMRRKQPATVFWENVPGVLSTKDNAFGCFLAGLAGEDEPLVPPGGKWANAGAVYGPKRAIAWRTLDAQYFGLAQRRRRVFVVASARKGFDPATVLFEWDGLRRDSAPSREEGEETAATLDARAEGGGFPGTDGACGGHVQPVASGSRHNSHWNGGPHPPLTQASQARAGGIGASNQEIFEQGGAGLVRAYGGNRTSGPIEVSPALLAQPGSGWKGDFESEAFLVQPTHTLRGEGFDASEDGTGRGTPLVPVLGFNAHCAEEEIRQQGLGPGSAALLRALAEKDDAASAAIAHVDIMPTMTCGGGHEASHSQVSGQMRDQFMVPTSAMQVRRLTPRECERLQGFPDDYTLIPWRTYQEAARKGASYEGLLHQRGMTLRGPSREECPDGPRYKALGNSWAVPNVAWIGRRIDAALRSLELAEAA